MYIQFRLQRILPSGEQHDDRWSNVSVSLPEYLADRLNDNEIFLLIHYAYQNVLFKKDFEIRLEKLINEKPIRIADELVTLKKLRKVKERR